jgi:hypothetical protein
LSKIVDCVAQQVVNCAILPRDAWRSVSFVNAGPAPDFRT